MQGFVVGLLPLTVRGFFFFYDSIGGLDCSDERFIKSHVFSLAKVFFEKEDKGGGGGAERPTHANKGM